jgi:hypothetical protein
MKVTAMMEPRLNAKVLAQGRIQRSIEPGHASRSARSRIFAAEKKKSEDAFHDTENMDVQRTMDESHTSWRRILQILNMRYYHAVL